MLISWLRIKRFERLLAQHSNESEYERDTFKAVESSLLAQVSELTAYVLLLLKLSSLTGVVILHPDR